MSVVIVGSADDDVRVTIGIHVARAGYRGTPPATTLVGSSSPHRSESRRRPGIEEGGALIRVSDRVVRRPDDHIVDAIAVHVARAGHAGAIVGARLAAGPRPERALEAG